MPKGVYERKPRVMSDKKAPLTQKQLEAVEMLMDGEMTKGQIAEELGVHRNTISAWCKDERFKAAIKECAEERSRQTMDYVKSKSLEAAMALWDMAEHSKDKRVSKEIYKFFVERQLGRLTTAIEVTDNRSGDDDFDIQKVLESFKSQEDSTPAALRIHSDKAG